MKTTLWIFTLLLSGATFLCSCDEETALLNSLNEGELTLKVSGDDKFARVNMKDCKWMNYGEDMKGEVFIEAHPDGESTVPFFNIMYGSWSNEIPFSVRSYSTGVEADMIQVICSSGSNAEDAIVKIDIVEITSTAIKGTYSGKVKDSTGIFYNVEGAFWAKKSETAH